MLITVQPTSAVTGPPCRITNSATRWMVGSSLTLVAAAESPWPQSPRPLEQNAYFCTVAAIGRFAPATPRLAPAAAPPPAPPPEALGGPSRPSRRCFCRGASKVPPQARPPGRPIGRSDEELAGRGQRGGGGGGGGASEEEAGHLCRQGIFSVCSLASMWSFSRCASCARSAEATWGAVVEAEAADAAAGGASASSRYAAISDEVSAAAAGGMFCAEWPSQMLSLLWHESPAAEATCFWDLPCAAMCSFSRRMSCARSAGET